MFSGISIWIPWAVIRIAKLRILDSTNQICWIPDSTSKHLADYGIRIPLLRATAIALSIDSFKMIRIFFLRDMRLFHLLAVSSFLFSIERRV